MDQEDGIPSLYPTLPQLMPILPTRSTTRATTSRELIHSPTFCNQAEEEPSKENIVHDMGKGKETNHTRQTESSISSSSSSSSHRNEGEEEMDVRPTFAGEYNSTIATPLMRTCSSSIIRPSEKESTPLERTPPLDEDHEDGVGMKTYVNANHLTPVILATTTITAPMVVALTSPHEVHSYERIHKMPSASSLFPFSSSYPSSSPPPLQPEQEDRQKDISSTKEMDSSALSASTTATFLSPPPPRSFIDDAVCASSQSSLSEWRKTEGEDKSPRMVATRVGRTSPAAEEKEEEVDKARETEREIVHEDQHLEHEAGWKRVERRKGEDQGSEWNEDPEGKEDRNREQGTTMTTTTSADPAAASSYSSNLSLSTTTLSISSSANLSCCAPRVSLSLPGNQGGREEENERKAESKDDENKEEETPREEDPRHHSEKRAVSAASSTFGEVLDRLTRGMVTRRGTSEAAAAPEEDNDKAKKTKMKAEKEAVEVELEEGGRSQSHFPHSQQKEERLGGGPTSSPPPCTPPPPPPCVATDETKITTRMGGKEDITLKREEEADNDGEYSPRTILRDQSKEKGESTFCERKREREEETAIDNAISTAAAAGSSVGTVEGGGNEHDIPRMKNGRKKKEQEVEEESTPATSCAATMTTAAVMTPTKNFSTLMTAEAIKQLEVEKLRRLLLSTFPVSLQPSSFSPSFSIHSPYQKVNAPSPPGVGDATVGVGKEDDQEEVVKVLESRENWKRRIMCQEALYALVEERRRRSAPEKEFLLDHFREERGEQSTGGQTGEQGPVTCLSSSSLDLVSSSSCSLLPQQTPFLLQPSLLQKEQDEKSASPSLPSLSNSFSTLRATRHEEQKVTGSLMPVEEIARTMTPISTFSPCSSFFLRTSHPTREQEEIKAEVGLVGRGGSRGRSRSHSSGGGEDPVETNGGGTLPRGGAKGKKPTKGGKEHDRGNREERTLFDLIDFTLLPHSPSSSPAPANDNDDEKEAQGRKDKRKISTASNTCRNATNPTGAMKNTTNTGADHEHQTNNSNSSTTGGGTECAKREVGGKGPAVSVLGSLPPSSFSSSEVVFSSRYISPPTPPTLPTITTTTSTSTMKDGSSSSLPSFSAPFVSCSGCCGCSSVFPLQAFPSETPLQEDLSSLLSHLCEDRSYVLGAWRRFFDERRRYDESVACPSPHSWITGVTSSLEEKQQQLQEEKRGRRRERKEEVKEEKKPEEEEEEEEEAVSRKEEVRNKGRKKKKKRLLMFALRKKEENENEDEKEGSTTFCEPSARLRRRKKNENVLHSHRPLPHPHACMTTTSGECSNHNRERQQSHAEICKRTAEKEEEEEEEKCHHHYRHREQEKKSLDAREEECGGGSEGQQKRATTKVSESGLEEACRGAAPLSLSSTTFTTPTSASNNTTGTLSIPAGMAPSPPPSLFFEWPPWTHTPTTTTTTTPLCTTAHPYYYAHPPDYLVDGEELPNRGGRSDKRTKEKGKNNKRSMGTFNTGEFSSSSEDEDVDAGSRERGGGGAGQKEESPPPLPQQSQGICGSGTAAAVVGIFPQGGRGPFPLPSSASLMQSGAPLLLSREEFQMYARFSMSSGKLRHDCPEPYSFLMNRAASLRQRLEGREVEPEPAPPRKRRKE